MGPHNHLWPLKCIQAIRQRLRTGGILACTCSPSLCGFSLPDVHAIFMEAIVTTPSQSHLSDDTQMGFGARRRLQSGILSCQYGVQFAESHSGVSG